MDNTAGLDSLDPEEQARVIHEAKLATLGLVVSAVAHELNNPIAGVLACVDALETGSVPSEQRAETFDTIRDALERMATTVQSLLTYSRRGGQGLGSVDLAGVVAACRTLLGPLTGRRGVTLSAGFGPGDVTAEACESELTQALMNVIANAVRASDPGQSVVVDARSGADGRLEISVTDHGRGMSDEVLSHACEPFFTTRNGAEGTGLGLFITRQLVEGLGGQLRLQSELGVGTTVRISLPARS